MAGDDADPLKTALKTVGSRADSEFSLDRSTEKDGIVVDEGYCNISDPNFGDAAHRLALLDLDNFDRTSRPASRPGSRRSLHLSQRNINPAPFKSNSANSLPTRQTGSPTASSISNSSQARAIPSASHDAHLSGAADSFPPDSPFSTLEVQSILFPAMSAEEAEDKLKNKGIDKRLLSGLKSLSPDELTLYMQLTEELKREGVGQVPLSAQALHGSSGELSQSETGSSLSSQGEERLEIAVRKLRTLLPRSAIEALQSHASYGLMDVIQSQPLTPPPTPTSTITE